MTGGIGSERRQDHRRFDLSRIDGGFVTEGFELPATDMQGGQIALFPSVDLRSDALQRGRHPFHGTGSEIAVSGQDETPLYSRQESAEEPHPGPGIAAVEDIVGLPKLRRRRDADHLTPILDLGSQLTDDGERGHRVLSPKKIANGGGTIAEEREHGAAMGDRLVGSDRLKTQVKRSPAGFDDGAAHRSRAPQASWSVVRIRCITPSISSSERVPSPDWRKKRNVMLF